MKPIVTLNIKLSGATGDNAWSARVEVPAETTLNELHDMIQQLVDFDNDHLHEFFAGRNWRNRRITFGEADTPFELNEGEEVPLSSIFPLPTGHKLFYHFDFGDDWYFEITSRANAKQTDQKMKYPRLVHEKGRRPKQYGSEDDD